MSKKTTPNPLTLKAFNKSQFQEQLELSEMSKVKIERACNALFDGFTTAIANVQSNDKYIVLTMNHTPNISSITACNRYTRYIRRSEVDMKKKGIVVKEVRAQQKADEFNFHKGLAIAASRLVRSLDELSMGT